jgi:ABC-type spermidine/putrescine transport system permease subunit I
MMIEFVPGIDRIEPHLPRYTHVGVAVGFLTLFLLFPIGLLVFNSLNFGGALLENYRIALSGVYIDAMVLSFVVATVTTPILLVFAFGVSYYLAFVTTRTRLLLGFVLLPMWIAYIIRYLGIQLLLSPNGPVVGSLGTNFGLLSSTAGVVLGLVSAFLPFAVLPIYNSLSSLDENLIDASVIMGASRVDTVVRVILPVALPGVVTAGLLVFILCAGAFLAPAILGGPSDLMIANMIQRSYTEIFNIQLAAALAVIYTLVLAVLIAAFNSYLNIGEVLSDI